MTTSSTPEDTIAECKRRVDECHALLESTIVPEYRLALSAMAKAWMKDRSKREKTPNKFTRHASTALSKSTPKQHHSA